MVMNDSQEIEINGPAILDTVFRLYFDINEYNAGIYCYFNNMILVMSALPP